MSIPKTAPIQPSYTTWDCIKCGNKNLIKIPLRIDCGKNSFTCDREECVCGTIHFVTVGIKGDTSRCLI